MTGRVSCTENDTVIDVWMDNAIIGMNTYIIKGKRNSANELIVRLEGDGWSFNRKKSRGITKFQPSKIELFNVVADGNQKLKADKGRKSGCGCTVLDGHPYDDWLRTGFYTRSES